MLWRKRTHTPITHTTAPVPDTEALRRALLHASQRRSRWVSRRRVALRWALWGLRRSFLPIFLLLAVAVAVLRWHASALDVVPQVVDVPPQAAPPTPALQVTPEPTSEPETEAEVHLRWEPAWRSDASPPRRAPQPAAAETTDPTPPPHLKPENWLHSKEP